MADKQDPLVKRDVCGIIMPISALDTCSEAHWGDVKEILDEAIEEAGFEPSLEVSVIQKRIIQNLYDNPIVACDISCRNANVMFELGLRLAFDKPTIIVKDDKTPFSFDTSPIEHLEYPRDLRFGKIVEFRKRLAEKIRATHQAATQDPKYTTFLKHFGEFTVAKLNKKEVPTQQFILDEFEKYALGNGEVGKKQAYELFRRANPRTTVLHRHGGQNRSRSRRCAQDSVCFSWR